MKSTSFKIPIVPLRRRHFLECYLLFQCSKTTALYIRGRAGKQSAEGQVRLQMKCRSLWKSRLMLTWSNARMVYALCRKMHIFECDKVNCGINMLREWVKYGQIRKHLSRIQIYIKVIHLAHSRYRINIVKGINLPFTNKSFSLSQRTTLGAIPGSEV